MQYADISAELLERVRARAPLVQCITNFVAMDIAANLVLAIGASPAMVHAKEEVEEFAAIASALTINIGTIAPEWVEGMSLAASTASRIGLPWVLDPVACGATRWRTQVARELAAKRPTLIRGNASEILALQADRETTTRGVDSTDPVERAQTAARALAKTYGAIVAVTGATDFVTDGSRELGIEGGDPLMTKVTALGCSLTAVSGAFLAVGDSAFESTVAALASFKIAGSRSALNCPGPGTLRWRMADELHRLDAAAMRSEARLLSYA
ncbi:hydroxyethylthiazole kinase [Arboricoccus pini]|uniref:Hydroxyethylthiazole kinase n=1 Tax=Arboricoccus pini TaxID=1963835 RepID=A0A212R7A6_9PROT|nr:hydroxyethylthiazole kinase [Arboricoccus pini]SNB68029.1 hydroxyethylthiazole kinase [Arboricoccus pini]